MADFGKLNLAALNHQIAKFNSKSSKEPIECIVIPIEKNNLFKSDKGNVYLDLVAFKLKEPTKDEDGAVQQTHLVKQSLPKTVREKMTDEEKNSQPIIGSLNVYSGGAFTESKPNLDDSFTPDPGDDDLPF